MMGVGAAPARDAELAIRAIRRDAQARLIDLHGWLQEWSETARAVIKRRDQLIRLGIGKRRVRPAT